MIAQFYRVKPFIDGCRQHNRLALLKSRLVCFVLPFQCYFHSGQITLLQNIQVVHQVAYRDKADAVDADRFVIGRTGA